MYRYRTFGDEENEFDNNEEVKTSNVNHRNQNPKQHVRRFPLNDIST